MLEIFSGKCSKIFNIFLKNCCWTCCWNIIVILQVGLKSLVKIVENSDKGENSDFGPKIKKHEILNIFGQFWLKT